MCFVVGDQLHEWARREGCVRLVSCVMSTWHSNWWWSCGLLLCAVFSMCTCVAEQHKCLHLQGEVSHVWGGRCLCRQSSRWKCSGGKKGQVVTEVLKRAAPTWVLIVCVFCALLPSAQSCYFQNRPLLWKLLPNAVTELYPKCDITELSVFLKLMSWFLCVTDSNVCNLWW